MFEDMQMTHGFDDDNDFMPLISIEEDAEEDADELFPDELPLLAIKNTVLFPGIVLPITVGRDKSIKAINVAYKENRTIAVVSQRDSEVEEPGFNDLYQIGTVARILKLLRMPDGTITAILQGRRRFQMMQLLQDDPYLKASIQMLQYTNPENALEFEALVASILDKAKQIIELSPNIPSEANVMLRNITNRRFLLNFIASNINSDNKVKQVLLEMNPLFDKGNALLKELNNELQLLELKDQIETKVRGDIEKQQRDYFLNQQLKTIQEELGQNPQQEQQHELRVRADKKEWPKTVDEAFNKELSKLKRMNPQAPDYSIQLNYLELMLDLPWQSYSEDNFDLQRVQKILDADHYGLDKVKRRILEHLAVLKLKGDMKAPILCLVGPPGVGKTSLGRSIANALERKFFRMSLGGLHDESEIRGHRKTYIGALPGRILQGLKKAGTGNPVFILDEIDKVGKTFRGDPSSALLEVLDPEQNTTFHDNYLDIEYDLSKVLFIATANSLSTIQPALLDRMEIINISGYSTEEKVEIAKRHLTPKQRKDHGLKAADVTLRDTVVKRIIRDYTRESGVRSLSRQIGGVMRHIAKHVAMEESYNKSVKAEELATILGPARYTDTLYKERQEPGVSIGLAWTQVGGEILFVECSLSKGKGGMTITGNLGDVMKESARTAMSFLRAQSESLGIDPEIFAKQDIHVHVPEGAIPKDGPSAGITMLTAMTSAFTKKRVRKGLAMSGEITLRGKVLPVGGIKEKVLAAKRAGMTDIMLCAENERNVKEIQPEYIKGLNFHYVKSQQEVLDFALV